MTQHLEKRIAEIRERVKRGCWDPDCRAGCGDHAPDSLFLLNALEIAVEGLKRYGGHSLEVIEGRVRLKLTPAEDAPGMPFYEGETWLLGEHADKALSAIENAAKGDEV